MKIIDNYLIKLNEQGLLKTAGNVVSRVASNTARTVAGKPTLNKHIALDICYKKYCFEAYKNTNINAKFNKKNETVCKLKCYLNYLHKLKEETDTDLATYKYKGIMLRTRQVKTSMISSEINRVSNKIKHLSITR